MYHDGYVVDHGILPRDYGLVNCVVRMMSCPLLGLLFAVSYFLLCCRLLSLFGCVQLSFFIAAFR